MPENYGWTRDGKQQPIDEKLWDDAKKACAAMKKEGDYACIGGMYKKNWERENGRELLGSPPGGAKSKAGGEAGSGGHSPASASGVTPGE